MDVCNLDDKPEAFTVTKDGKFLDYQLCQSEAVWFLQLIKEADCPRRFCHSIGGFEICACLGCYTMLIGN
jgi:hypothetical protein